MSERSPETRDVPARADDAIVATPRQRLEYLGYRAGTGLLRALPEERGARLATWLAARVFDAGGRRRRVALANLRIALPELTEERRRAIARQSYVHSALDFVDLVRASGWSAAEVARRAPIEGLEHIEKARARGRGALLLTLHLGNFELAIASASVHGLPVSIVARPLANPLVWRELASLRTRFGAELVGHRRIAPRVLRALRAGRCVAVVNDQYARLTKGIFVPFFGVRASTSAGVATLAIRSGAPVVPVYALREAPDRHRIVVMPALETPQTGDRRRDARAATRLYNAVFESIIRRHPEHWMWGHRRFRHSPDLPGDPYAG